jgi:hypothetical protein
MAKRRATAKKAALEDEEPLGQAQIPLVCPKIIKATVHEVQEGIVKLVVGPRAAGKKNQLVFLVDKVSALHLHMKATDQIDARGPVRDIVSSDPEVAALRSIQTNVDSIHIAALWLLVQGEISDVGKISRTVELYPGRQFWAKEPVTGCPVTFDIEAGGLAIRPDSTALRKLKPGQDVVLHGDIVELRSLDDAAMEAAIPPHKRVREKQGSL